MTATYPGETREGLRRGNETPSRLVPRLLTVGCATICVALVCYTARDGLSNLYDRWAHEEEYGYGFLIVALVPLLVWRRWPILLSHSAGAAWPGLVIVAIAQLCAILGVLGESYFIEQLALLMSIMGIGLVVFGFGATRVILPIALLLLLTVPLPYTLQAMLTIKLQLISTNLGVAIIQFLGIPVYVEGNIIDLGSYKLQVAEACSGLRYLLPLTCVSFLVAYLYRAAFWKKVVVVLSAAPLTILLNSFRIGITALLVNNYGIQMAEGFLHEFEGWIVFLMGMLLLGIEVLALQGFRWSNVEVESIMDRPLASRRPAASFRLGVPLILSLFVCAATLGITNSIASAYNSMPSLARDGFADFPHHIDRWTGQSAALDPESLDALKATDTYNGDFTEDSGAAPVNLFVAYYDSLSKGAAIHSPRVCLPGSGWEFASFQEKSFSGLEPGVRGTYNDVVVQKGEQKMLMYYWYQQRERRTANEFSMKYYLLLDSFFEGRKDGALVRLFTPIDATAGDKGLAQARARLHDFAHAISSTMPNYLPN